MIRWMMGSSAPSSSIPTPPSGIPKKQGIRMNMFTAINDAIRVAMKADENVILFGEDVGFGGVFRCSVGLQQEFGKSRVFNTPLTGKFWSSASILWGR